jgi:hypothetical protein
MRMLREHDEQTPTSALVGMPINRAQMLVVGKDELARAQPYRSVAALLQSAYPEYGDTTEDRMRGTPPSKLRTRLPGNPEEVAAHEATRSGE